MNSNGIRLALLILEQGAIEEDVREKEAIEKGRRIEAEISRIVSAKFRAKATQIERAWKEELERDS